MATAPSKIAVNREIKGQIYDTLRTALVKPQGKSKKSFTEDFIKKMLEEAKENPSGPLGQLIAKQLMQDDIITSLDEATEKYLSKDYDFMEYRLIKFLYDKQREIFLDNLVRRKCIMTSRRCGKTTLATRLLVKDCIRPGRNALFISLKFENAIRQAFDETLKMANEIDLSIARSSKSEGIIEFNNGSSILFKGNSNKAEADKFRGGKYSLVIIDECQSQTNMNYLVNDVIGPMLMDYDDSTLILQGTPPRVPHTYFEKVWNNDEWKRYHFKMSDNPFIKNVGKEIEKICLEKGITIDDSLIRREYMGELAYDTEAQVFKGRTTYLIPSNLAELNFTNICVGVDFGFSDYNAVVSLAYNKNTRQAWVIRENKFNHADISTIVSVIKEHDEAAKAALLEKGMEPEVDVFCDNNEKSIIAELKRNYGVRAYPAWKHDKAMAIEQLAEELRTGRMNIPLHGALDDEMDSILYKRDEGTDAILPELDEDLGVHPDIMMALLYASRQYFHELGIEAGGESKEKKTGELQ